MTPPAPSPNPPPRLDAVDLLRGLVMVVMALDHTRDFFHAASIQGVPPLDLARTTPWIFFTRFITHYCAPTFMFLAGTGAFLASMRGKPKRELSWFLITRGLWLIFLELTLLMWFGWDFSIHPTSYTLATLWALGWAMIVLAGLIHLPLWAITAFGLTLIGAHNAFDGVKPESWGAWGPLWQVLHAGGGFKLAGGRLSFEAFYPLIPWVGVMAVGYSFGAIYRWESSVRRRWLFRLGLSLIAAFLVLRFTNVYGDPHPWTAQPRAGFTLLSFLNCQKYPPSLSYLLITLGPGLIFLSRFDQSTPRWLKPLLVYGRVPMFYYLIHIPLLHGLAVIMNRVRFGGGDFSAFGTTKPPADAGVGLIAVYAIWLAVVIALYPACRWFADLKRRRRDAWLSYF